MGWLAVESTEPLLKKDEQQLRVVSVFDMRLLLLAAVSTLLTTVAVVRAQALTPCEPNPCLNGGVCYVNGPDNYYCVCNIYWTGFRCESPNYIVNDTCGDLVWANYSASNGFTRLCYFWPPPEDVTGRNTQCRYTIQNIPLYNNYNNLMAAGGNFGCLVSQNYPEDLPASSVIACADNYQQDITLGAYNEYARIMVCLRYPYEGIPLK